MEKIKLNITDGVSYVIVGLPLLFIAFSFIFDFNDAYRQLTTIGLAVFFYVFIAGLIWGVVFAAMWFLLVASPLIFISKKIHLSKFKVIAISASGTFIWVAIFCLLTWHASEGRVIDGQRLTLIFLLISILIGAIGGLGLVSPKQSLEIKKT